MITRALYLLLILGLSGCIISAKPDCDDITTQLLTTRLKGFIEEAIRTDVEAKRDSVKAKFKEAGFNYMSILPPENPTPKYDSLKSAFYLAMDRLDTLREQKVDSITSITNDLKVKETGKLISEDENSILTTFHCICKAEYTLNGSHKYFEYRLTRHDFDSHTYLKVTYASKPW